MKTWSPINVIALICIAASAYVLVHGNGGWAWFFLAGLTCAGLGLLTNKDSNP
jgi:hypothetical protein